MLAKPATMPPRSESDMPIQSHSRPPIQFGNWHKWNQRLSLPERRFAGVYVIARFQNTPNLNLPADPLDVNVIYIGEASANMVGRWRDFENALFGKVQNKRAKRYKERFPGGVKKADLYLAIMSSSPLQWGDESAEDRTERVASQFEISIEKANRFVKHMDTTATAGDKGDLNRAWVMLVERELIFDYIARWGKLPDGNSE